MKLINHFAKLLLGLLISQGISANTAAIKKVHEYQLDNGLKILVKPITRAPVASVQLWYKVGSSYEHTGITGLSHMLEHLMFKGTAKVPGNSFSKRVSELGGSQNAFTSRDYTAYYQNVASQHVEQMIRLEADRMRNLIWNQTEFLKEQKVVLEERRLRVEDSPQSRLVELHRMQAFTLNPNRIPVIGWMNDIENYQIKDIKAWYDRWYYPNNAILVVVGDVVPENIFEWAKTYYGVIPSKPIEPIKPRVEPTQSASSINHLTLDRATPQTLISFPAPSLVSLAEQQKSTKDAYALMLLAAILDQGASSRLVKSMLLEDQSVARISASYNPYSLHSGLFTFSATSNGTTNLEAIEQAIIKHLQAIQKEPPSNQELQRVIAQAKAAHVYQQDSLFYQGYELGALEALGLGWQIADQYLTQLGSVSAQDVQRVAQSYFDLDRVQISRLNDPSKSL